MQTAVINIRQDARMLNEEEEAALRRAGKILREGGLVAFPTETVYGLGGDALNPESSRKIYAAKGRPSDNPLIVHISKFEDIYAIAEAVPETVVRVAEAFWPGPLTMILRKSPLVPGETTGGLDTVAVRLPSNATARRLIEFAGGYVAAPSANLSGKPSPTVAKYVIQDMDGRIDMIVDGGEVGIGLESTIIDMTVSPPQILRPGYITKEMLEQVLSRVDSDVTMFRSDTKEAPKAPGMKYRHYAPKGELVIVQGQREQVASYINERMATDRERGFRTGVVAASESVNSYVADVVKCVGSRSDEEGIARHLFRILREFDDEDVDRIYSESFTSPGLGQAIMNRLLKAAGHKIIDLNPDAR